MNILLWVLCAVNQQDYTGVEKQLPVKEVKSSDK